MVPRIQCNNCPYLLKKPVDMHYHTLVCTRFGKMRKLINYPSTFKRCRRTGPGIAMLLDNPNYWTLL